MKIYLLIVIIRDASNCTLFSTQPHCCLTFLRIELQKLLRFDTFNPYHFIIGTFVSMSTIMDKVFETNSSFYVKWDTNYIFNEFFTNVEQIVIL